MVSDFEKRWLDGDRPSLDAHLAGVDAEQRFSVLVELVHVELEFRLEAGEVVHLEDYLQRYPELDRLDMVSS
jgi:hypothetical protein